MLATVDAQLYRVRSVTGNWSSELFMWLNPEKRFDGGLRNHVSSVPFETVWLRGITGMGG